MYPILVQEILIEPPYIMYLSRVTRLHQNMMLLNYCKSDTILKDKENVNHRCEIYGEENNRNFQLMQI